MEDFARAILEAQKIREESWDNEAANRMENENAMIKDFERCYTKSMYDAANEAAENAGYDKRGTMPIYLLNKYCWNDIQCWANETIKEVK